MPPSKKKKQFSFPRWFFFFVIVLVFLGRHLVPIDPKLRDPLVQAI